MSGFELTKSDIRSALTDLSQDALAIAIVTRDGTVAYHFGYYGKIAKDAEKAAQIIALIAAFDKRPDDE